MKSAILEIGALVRKRAVDESELKPIAKELIKLAIDGVKEFLKQYQPPKQLDAENIGIDPGWLACIRREAAALNLVRVNAVPFMLYGQREFLFEMYGENVDGFCAKTGIICITGDIPSKESDEIAQLFRKHGIVLYEKQV